MMSDDPSGPRAPPAPQALARVRPADPLARFFADTEAERAFLEAVHPPAAPGGEAADRTAGATARRSLLSFLLGGEEYALPIARVREIIKARRVTPVPRVPAFISGVISLRGSVLPVVDLRKRLGLPATTPDGRSRILVVADKAGDPVGLFVDGVMGVLRALPGEIETAPPLGAGRTSEYLEAVVHTSGGLVILLETDAVLDLAGEVHVRA